VKVRIVVIAVFLSLAVTAFSSLSTSVKILSSIRRVRDEAQRVMCIESDVEALQKYPEAIKFFDSEMESFLQGYDKSDRQKVREYLEYLSAIKMSLIFAVQYADPDLNQKLLRYSRSRLENVVRLSKSEAKGLR